MVVVKRTASHTMISNRNKKSVENDRGVRFVPRRKWLELEAKAFSRTPVDGPRADDINDLYLPGCDPRDRVMAV